MFLNFFFFFNFVFFFFDYIAGFLSFFFSSFLVFFNDYLILFFFIFFFFTSISSFLFFNYLGFYGIFVINLLSIFFLWLVFFFFVDDFFFKNYYFYFSFGKWILLGSNLRISFDFLFDIISVSFAFLTISIGLCAYFYCYSYFRYEPNVERLVIFLNLFMISMMFLVTSNNLISLFLGWELIGLTSFFLINFWVCRINTFKSAFKAFSFNKFSDVFFLVFILMIFNLTFSFDISVINNSVSFYSSVFINFFFFKVSYVDVCLLFLVLCAFIKSAQFGPHIWLPDSMEAPVPASSLIHSATLVSAGIFLLLRFYSIFEISYFFINFVPVVGSLTAFLGGFISMHQSDTKKTLAYSTISHCGFLMVVLSTGVIEYCLLYLYVHGFFKAGVFMCVGNLNRFNKNIQDFKKMGNFWKFLPFEMFLGGLGLINLSGLPFTLGFFIKHYLFVALDSNFILFYFIFINCFFGAICGVFYSFRIVFNSFFDFKKARLFFYTTSSSQNLKSYYYSNTSLASNVSIFFIYTIAYFVCIYFFFIFSSGNFIFSDTFFYSSFNFSVLNFLPSNDFLNNFSYSNFIILIFMFFVFFTNWRSVFLFNFISSFYFIFYLIFLSFFYF